MAALNLLKSVFAQATRSRGGGNFVLTCRNFFASRSSKAATPKEEGAGLGLRTWLFLAVLFGGFETVRLYGDMEDAATKARRVEAHKLWDERRLRLQKIFQEIGKGSV